MKQTICYLILVLVMATSCNTVKSSNSSDPPEIKEAIDEIYKTILNYEFKKEINTSMVTIVDRAIEKTNIESYNGKFVNNDSIDVVIWKKELYPRANYIDGRLVYAYLTQEPENYLSLVNNNNGYGWYELSIPSFTANRNEAIIDVKFYFAKPNNKNYYSFFKAFFNRQNGKYKYTGREIINSSQK